MKGVVYAKRHYASAPPPKNVVLLLNTCFATTASIGCFKRCAIIIKKQANIVHINTVMFQLIFINRILLLQKYSMSQQLQQKVFIFNLTFNQDSLFSHFLPENDKSFKSVKSQSLKRFLNYCSGNFNIKFNKKISQKKRGRRNSNFM